MATKRVGTIFVELDLDPKRYMRAQQTMAKEAKTGAKVLEKNFKNLGIKSGATFDLMRNQAVQSFEAIKRSGKATANDLIRAEKAKAEKIKRINREQFGEQHKLLNKLKSNWKSYGLVAIAAITAVVYTTKKLVESVAESGDQLHKMSLRTGVAVEELSALGYAAQISGTKIETVEKSLRYASKVMVDYSRGIGLAKRTFEELGLTVVDSTGKMKGTAAFLIEVSDKIRNMADETKKAAFISEIFGAKAGTQLLPLLKLGSQGIEDLMDKAKELGIVMSTTEAAIAAEFTDTMTDLTGSLEGLKRVIGIELMPELIEVAEKTTAWVIANRELIGQKAHEAVDKITVSVKSIIDVYNSLPDGVIGASASGIVGRILFGGVAGKTVFLAVLMNTQLSKIEMGIGDVIGKFKDLKTIWDATMAGMHFEDYAGFFGGGEPSGGAGGGFESPLKLTIGGPGQIPDRGEAESYQQMTDNLLSLTTMRNDEIMALEMLQAELLAEQMMANDTAKLEEKSNLEKYMAGQLYHDLESMRWEHAERMVAIAEKEKIMKINAAQMTANRLVQTGKLLMAASGKQNKALFEITKAAAIASAMVNTYKAVMIAKASAPPPWNYVLAAAELAYGLAQVNSIKSQSISGAGGGGGGGVGVPVTSPTTAPMVDLYPRDAEPKGGLTIIIEGDMIGDEGYIEMLAEKISEAVKDRNVTLYASNAETADQVI